jgi:FtsH-binding integral membrane protein
MMSIRSVLNRIAATVAMLAAAGVPAYAQTTAATTTADQGGGPSLLWVWVWILVVGVIVFIVGTSMGVSRGGRR